MSIKVSLKYPVDFVDIKPGQHTLSEDVLMNVSAMKPRAGNCFPGQMSYKGLANILWLFNFTTTRPGLQEILSKL